MRQHWVGSWMRLVTTKAKTWLEAWNSGLYPLSSREGGRAGNGGNNWSCLTKEDSIKSKWQGVQRACGLWNTWRCWQSGALGMEAPWPFPCTSCPSHLFHLSIDSHPLLYPLKTDKCKKVFLWVPVKPEEGVVGTSKSDGSCGNLSLWLASEREVRDQYCGAKSLTCGI